MRTIRRPTRMLAFLLIVLGRAGPLHGMQGDDAGRLRPAESQGGAVLSRSTISQAERLQALASLWQEARFSFAYFDRVAGTWDSLFRAFIPRVQSASSDYAYYLELMRFYAHLHDGHSGVFWPAEFDRALGYPPIEIRWIEGRPVIFRILEPTDELSRLGVRPGLAILRVDGRPVEDRMAYWRAIKTGSTEQATNRLASFRILTGPRNSTVEVVVQEPGGATRTLRLTRSAEYFGDTNLQPEALYASRPVDDGIGYFRADQMSGPVAEAFDAYVEKAVGLRGLIVDLRYNGGGSDLISGRMVSRLIDRPLDGQIYEITGYRADRRATRQEQEVIRTRGNSIRPARGARFTGTVVVLIGAQTHSATEGGFLSVIRSRPSTVFLGETTAGSTGQPLVFALPGGGVGAVCSRRTLAPDGHAFVGVGFHPDIREALTQEDLFQGRDRVLERAIKELGRLGK